MGRNLPPSQIIPARPAFQGLRRWWRRVRAKPQDYTVRYFVAYDYHWKQFLNGASKHAMGHCVLDVGDGGIDSWEKVCAIQSWVTNAVMRENAATPEATPDSVISHIRISNFIPLTKFLTPSPDEHTQQQPVSH